jgi:cytochrome c-type biogenesis protein CcmE
MKLVRRQKLIFICFIGLILAIVSALVLFALRQNISLFYSPTQIANGEVKVNQNIRVGGMVVPGSIVRSLHDLSLQFNITDYKHTIIVHYRGILPDLFREGQGIVAQGKIANLENFNATNVLAKHDEKYMPPEVKGILDKSLVRN